MRLLSVELPDIEFRKTLTWLAATEDQIGRAQQRAVSKTLNWARTQLSRELARGNDFPVSVFRGGKKNREGARVRKRMGSLGSGNAFKSGPTRIGPVTGIAGGSLWVGLSDIKAKYLGKPRQQKKGVRVRNSFFHGAWVRDYGGQGGLAVLQRMQGRVVAATEPVWGVPIEGVQRRIPARLATLLDQEINFEVRVKGR